MLVQDEVGDDHRHGEINQRVAEKHEIRLFLLHEQPEIQGGEAGGKQDLEQTGQIVLHLGQRIFLVDEE